LKAGFWVIIATSVLLVACEQGPLKPAAIDERVDVCIVCNMFVKNNGYAAELINKNGRVYKFDDVGELFPFEKEHASERFVASFVQDARTKQWIDISKALWLKDLSVSTPMDFGIHAFSDQAGVDLFKALHPKANAISLEALR